MDSLTAWASQVSASLGLGPLGNARTGLAFKPEAHKERKRRKPKVSSSTKQMLARQEAQIASRTLQAKATPPLDIWFDVPNTLEEGQTQVAISGPHGPLQITLPEDCKPGQRIRHRLGPKVAQVSVVPEGKAEGDTMTLHMPDGEQMQVRIPPGKKAGDEFEVSPPVLMVQVPEGAKCGSTVTFATPDGHTQTAKVPYGVPVHHYFEIPYDPPGAAQEGGACASLDSPPMRSQCTAPLDICFDVPEILHEETRTACVLGPHGPLQLRVPDGAGAGDRVRVRLGPKEGFSAKVPEGKKAGDLMSLETADGVTLQVTVPPGKGEGEEFDVSPPVLMVRVPEMARPGTKVVFNAPDGVEMTSVVPEGFPPASYFEVPLVDSKLPAAPAPASSPQEEAEEEQARREISQMSPCEPKKQEAEEEPCEEEKEEEKQQQEQEENTGEKEEEEQEVEKEQEEQEGHEEGKKEEIHAADGAPEKGDAQETPEQQPPSDEAEEKPETPKASKPGLLEESLDKENESTENTQPLSPGPRKAVLSPMGPLCTTAVLSPSGPTGLNARSPADPLQASIDNSVIDVDLLTAEKIVDLDLLA